MAINAVVHDCSKCKLHKRKIDILIDSKDIMVYKLLQTRIDNAVQASKPDALDAISDIISADEKAKYYEKVFKNIDDIQDLINEWWDLMKSRYNIPESSKVDYDDQCFFECAYDNGEASLTGEFIHKEDI